MTREGQQLSDEAYTYFDALLDLIPSDDLRRRQELGFSTAASLTTIEARFLWRARTWVAERLLEIDGTTYIGQSVHQAPALGAEKASTSLNPGGTTSRETQPVQQEGGSAPAGLYRRASTGTQRAPGLGLGIGTTQKETLRHLGKPPDTEMATPSWVSDLLKNLIEGNEETRRLTQRLTDLP